RKQIMRPLEWLLLLSFAPVLLTPIIPQIWRRRWLEVFAPLSALVGVLHLVIEGWRIQMLPLFGLAALVLVSRVPALLGREGAVRRGRGILVSVVLALMIIPSGI